jgi:hypothetical protein
MRKLIAAGIALVALAAGPGAMAADLAVKPKEPSSRQNIDTVRVGLSYKFGLAGPATSR